MEKIIANICEFLLKSKHLGPSGDGRWALSFTLYNMESGSRSLESSKVSIRVDELNIAIQLENLFIHFPNS